MYSTIYTMVQICGYKSPLGALIISVVDDTIIDANFAKKNLPAQAKFAPLPAVIKSQLDGYFSGTLKKFNLTYEIETTPFRQKVYAEMKKIPYGKTASYKELAQKIGNPNAVRAVASACAHNPIVLFVPCHRVIGTDGSLRGYAAGLWRKQWLLNKEAGKQQ